MRYEHHIPLTDSKRYYLDRKIKFEFSPCDFGYTNIALAIRIHFIIINTGYSTPNEAVTFEIRNDLFDQVFKNDAS